MKRSKLSSPLAILVCILFVSLNSCEGWFGGNSKCEEESALDSIHAVIDRYFYASETSNIELFLSCMTDDAWRLPPNTAPVIGINAIREEMEPILLNWDAEATSLDEDIFIIDGDYAISIHFYQIWAWPKGADKIEDGFWIEEDGKGITVFERQENCSWKTLFDMMNSNLPAPCLEVKKSTNNPDETDMDYSSSTLSANDNDVDHDSISAVMDRYAYASNTNNFELWMSCWDNDGWRLPPNFPPVIGKQAIREEMGPVFETMNFEVTLEKEIVPHIISQDHAISISYYKIWGWIKNEDKQDGFWIEPEGKVMTIYKKQEDGSWKFLWDIMNSNQAVSCSDN